MISVKRMLLTSEKNFLIVVFILSSLFKIGVSFFVELWPLGYDPLEHYQWALSILDGKFPTDRTFLYNIILSIFLYFNKDYWVAQIVNAFISNFFLIPFYYIAKNQFNKRVAMQSVVLINIVPFTIFGIATTPKLLVVFFLLIVYYFVLKKKYSWWISIASVMAFLAHQYSLFFLAPAFLLILKTNRKRALYFSSILIIVILSWMTLSPTESMFIYYPIAVNGWEGVKGTPKETILADFYSTPWYKIIAIRIVNFFIPITPLLFPLFKTIDFINPITLELHKTIDFSTQPWAYNYLQSFSGYIGILLYLFAILGVWKMKKIDLVYLILSSYIISVLFFGWIHPITGSVGLAYAPFLMMISVYEINKKKRNRLMMIILFSLLIELILMFITFGWFIEFTKENLIMSGSFEEYAKLNSLWKLAH